ncbi:MAG: hypothetical protein ACRYGO_06955 [Janthinobacterium lividum]
MDERQRLLERLPDYLNGHVAGDDARRIAALLESDAAWQAQAAVLEDVRAAVGAQVAAIDSEAGLDELKRRIAAAPLPPASASKAASAPAPAGWWQGLGMRLAPLFTPVAMAALAGVCVVQGWMLHRAPDTEVAWREAPLSVAAPAANLQVRFAADASLAQVEAALVQAGARIVTGPQGGQRYLLQADDPAAALARLRASAAVVEADVLAAESAPESAPGSSPDTPP